jgi:hypothetical protein
MAAKMTPAEGIVSPIALSSDVPSTTGERYHVVLQRDNIAIRLEIKACFR